MPKRKPIINTFAFPIKKVLSNGTIQLAATKIHAVGIKSKRIKLTSRSLRALKAMPTDKLEMAKRLSLYKQSGLILTNRQHRIIQKTAKEIANKLINSKFVSVAEIEDIVARAGIPVEKKITDYLFGEINQCLERLS